MPDRQDITELMRQEFSIITDSDLDGQSYQCEIETCRNRAYPNSGYARGDGSSAVARECSYPRWICPDCYSEIPSGFFPRNRVKKYKAYKYRQRRIPK